MDPLWKRWYFYIKMIWNNTSSSCSSSKMRLRPTGLLTVHILSFSPSSFYPLELNSTRPNHRLILASFRPAWLNYTDEGSNRSAVTAGPQSPDLKLFKQNDSAGLVHSVWTWTEMTSEHWSFRLTQKTHLVKLAAGITRSVSTHNCSNS